MDQAFGEDGWFTQWWQNTGKPAITSAWEKIVGWFKEAYNYLVGVFNPTEESTVVDPTDPNATPPAESSAEVQASKPFLTRMAEKIAQGFLNVLSTPEAQARFYMLGQAMVAGALSSVDSYLRTLTFEIPGKKDVLGYLDFGGIGPVKPFAGGGVVPNTTNIPSGEGGGSVLPFTPPETLNNDDELKQLLIQYFEQQQSKVEANGQTGSGAVMPDTISLQDLLDELEKQSEELRIIKRNTGDTSSNVAKQGR